MIKYLLMKCMGCVSCCCCCFCCNKYINKGGDDVQECNKTWFGILSYLLVIGFIFFIPYLSYLQSDEHWNKVGHTCKDMCGSFLSYSDATKKCSWFLDDLDL